MSCFLVSSFLSDVYAYMLETSMKYNLLLSSHMYAFTQSYTETEAHVQCVTEHTAVRSEGGYGLANLAQITRLQPAAV